MASFLTFADSRTDGGMTLSGPKACRGSMKEARILPHFLHSARRGYGVSSVLFRFTGSHVGNCLKEKAGLGCAGGEKAGVVLRYLHDSDDGRGLLMPIFGKSVSSSKEGSVEKRGGRNTVVIAVVVVTEKE